jgi:putative phosphoesterase
MRIGLLSDTHGFLDPKVLKYFEEVDEIWHAGDIGPISLTDKLSKFKPLRAVYGNIDDAVVRRQFPEDSFFEVAGLQVYMTHIGGYPGRYPVRIKGQLQRYRPGLFICGHSHILKVMPDPQYRLLHINPGAAGNHGFHQVKTIVRFSITNAKIHDLQVVELGPRGSADLSEVGIETP